MPTLTPNDQVVLHVSTCSKAQLVALGASGGKHPFPVAALVQQVVSDRLALAGTHLQTGDQLVSNGQFRSAISRYYYAMYHSARAIVFAVEQGDDFERHNLLPRHLPSNLVDVAIREAELTDARLLRNQADYDIYPTGVSDWDSDARSLASISAQFVGACENFALTNGYV